MERDWRDFKSLNGGIEGAREAFERACESLIRKIHCGKTVQQVRVKLGDGGIDVYVGELGIDPITVYQCKFFLEEFDTAQHAQIRSSFNTAVNSKKFQLKNWILCIPKVLDIDETVWWTNWKNKQIKLYEKDISFITLINGNELIELMKTYGIYEIIFKIEELILTRETHKNVTQLIKTFNPQMKGLPSIKWSTFIGKQKWKNTPLIIGESIYVGSAGNKWNKKDDNDGIYCLDLNNGNIKWMYQSYSDVNEISYFDGVIIGGCDDGTVHCISSKTGKLIWRKKFESAIVSKIYKDNGYSDTEKLIVTCYNGDILFLNLLTGKIINKIELKENIMGNITLSRINNNQVLFIPTINGKLYELTETGINFTITSNTSIVFKYSNHYSDKFSDAQLYAPPLIDGNRLYLGFVRNTYDTSPPIICLDLNTKETLWYASNPFEQTSIFGNIRTNLLLDNEEIIFTHPYSNEISSINKQNGRINWKTNLGRDMFQQWASPIMDEHSYYLSRYDGYLYKVNKVSKQREWGMYLGQNDDAGVVFGSSQKVGNENEHAAWELFKGHSLVSTPAISGNKIIVGSDEGML